MARSSIPGRVLRSVIAFGFASAVAAQEASVPARTAEVLDVQGTGERRLSSAAGWLAARPRDGLAAGDFVRTGTVSRMALMFADETQLRLSQNTLLEIKAIGASATEPTTLRLAQGRAWSQTRRAPDSLRFETPAAVAAVRGTDWEIEVGPDGRTLLVVLSGEVEYFNDLGRLVVGAGESAVAEVGKAPVRIVLASPSDRIQWVNALRFDATPYRPAAQSIPQLRAALDAIAVGNPGRAAEILTAARAAGVNDASVVEALAELSLVRGQFKPAIAILDEALKSAPREADLLALRARALMLDGRLDEARETLARPRDAETASILIAQGDLARREGHGLEAIEFYRRATRVAPDDARAFFALGRAQSEREDIQPARENLARALTLNPDGAGFAGELGTLETFINQFGRAEDAFAKALAAHPADYVALTGQGLMRLKRGDPEAALEALLRAGLMEPRFARAKVYTGVAYYQLGRHAEAIAALERATVLDDKDPMPWMLLSQIYTDLFQPGRAVAASREALVRLPYLKSLNQVADDQQGRANLGYALAFFGMEEWALEIAQQSYNAYAGSSHLFLADRYRNEYTKNSELFQGFLADPTAFGGSNRFSKLVPTAGHYATLGVTGETGDAAHDGLPYARANGLFDVPVGQASIRGAYYLDVERLAGTVEIVGVDASGAPRRTTGDNRASFGAVGLGAMLTPQLGVFAYGTTLDQTVSLRDQSGTEADLDKKRLDVGASWRFSPTALGWIKVGRTDEKQTFDNYLLVDEEAGIAQAASSTFDARPEDLQARASFDLTPRDHFTFGAEYAKDRRLSTLLAAGVVQVGDDVIGLGTEVDQKVKLRSKQAYVSYIRDVLPALSVQGDLAWTSFRQAIDETVDALLVINNESFPSTETTQATTTENRLDPRFGVVWKPGPVVLRAAYQRWTQPASVSTLAPVATAGIVQDDYLVAAGGRAERGVVKLHYEPDASTVLGAFYDDIDVKNLGESGYRIPTPQIEFVDLLRNQQLENVATLDLREGTPDFDQGRARSSGVYVNRIVTPALSLAARYVYTDQQARIYVRDESGEIVAESSGAKIPYLPQHLASAGLTLVLPQRFYVSAQAVWRSKRFTDRENTPEAALASDWNGQVVAFWESADKRFIVGFGALNIGSKAEAERYLADVRFRF